MAQTIRGGMLILLGLLQATLRAIYQTAVYCYAYLGTAPPGVDEHVLAASIRRR